jgi:hypothetical protein
MRKYFSFFIVFIFCTISSFAIGQENTLVKIMESLSAEKGIINTRRTVDTALLNQKYQYLQWWMPRVVIGNDLAYPYKPEDFDDLITSNTTNLTLALPLLTGTIINLTSGYSLNRNMTDLLEWGFSQNLQGKIGIEQSLNPWWLHTQNNPYKSGAVLQAEIAMTDYNIAMKNALYSSVSAYITLRKSERNMEMLIETIAFYDDIIASYRQNVLAGQMSLNEFQDMRRDKWEYEQQLFSLEQDIASLKNELFQNTGIEIGEISNEKLISIDDEIWTTMFLGVTKNDIAQLEQNSIALQKRGIMYERLINNQMNAPSINVDFGSSFLLPVQEKDKLHDAWKEEHFTDNELNNWSITASVNLSGLLSPANKKRRQEQRILETSLDILSNKILAEKEQGKYQNKDAIHLLETHIAQLSDIVDSDNILNEDMKTLYERGELSELEYKQLLITNKEKRLLLDNFNDDLWLHRFFASLLI